MTDTGAPTKFILNTEETGKRLRLFRKSRNITIQQLSEQTGLSRGMISEIEAGKTKPSATLMLALLKLYGLNINWLLTGEGKMIVKRKALITEKSSSAEVDDDYNQLLWYLENAPVVKYAVLSFFLEYNHKNKEIIDENIQNTRLKNQTDDSLSPTPLL